MKKEYYIKVSLLNRKAEYTRKMTAKEVLKYFNKLYAVWDTLKEFNYTSIEIYKSGDNLPKRILI